MLIVFLDAKILASYHPVADAIFVIEVFKSLYGLEPANQVVQTVAPNFISIEEHINSLNELLKRELAGRNCTFERYHVNLKFGAIARFLVWAGPR